MLSRNMAAEVVVNALTDPSSIIISTSLAKTLFGDADAVGKIIRLDNKDNYKVGGVFRDFPNNNPVVNTNSFPSLAGCKLFPCPGKNIPATSNG